jgi:hypothetical protein
MVALLLSVRKDLLARISQLGVEASTSLLLQRLVGEVDASILRIQTEMTQAFGVARTEAITLGIKLANDGLPKIAISAGFGLSQDLLSAIATYHAGEVQRVTSVLRQQITNQVQLGILGGKTVDQVATDIGVKQLKPIGPFKTAAVRAEAIARTEMNFVGNLAASEGLNDAAMRIPGLEKEWLSALDLRTRPSHRAANEQTIKPGEKFIIGGHKCDYPLDPSLPPAERVRCRCRVVAKIRKDVS